MQRHKKAPSSKLRKMPSYGSRRIVLGHRISSKELEVYQEKISTIETLVPSTTVRGV